MTTDRPKILLLGDSLTQLCFEGWGAILANVYQRRADVLNRGYSGYNTKFYLELPMEKLNNVCLVILFFGANDAALPHLADHHHVSLNDYATNLTTLVNRVKATYKNPPILLMTPPPVHHEQRLSYQKKRYGPKATGVLERTNETTGRYAHACKRVAQHCDVPCLDVYTKMSEQDDWGRFFNDGLHFDKAGHDFVGEQLLDAIHTHVPDLHVTACPHTGQWCNSSSSCIALGSQGPYHDEIDHTNVADAFVHRK
jgi:lysophospholipase L1-like esterase